MDNIALLRCAIEKIIPRVLLGTYETIDGIYVVKRGSRVGDKSQDQLQFYCVCSEVDPRAILALLSAEPFRTARSVILIGERNDAAARMLEENGFEADWETPVFFKDLHPSAPLALISSKRLPDSLKFVDITKSNLPIANSFCDELTISEPALLDASFINRLLLVDNDFVGKVQLILGPPYGAFCVLIAVRHDQRRRGYGSMMLQAAEGWVRDLALPQMALFSGTCANKINLYPRHGYTSSASYKVMRKSDKIAESAFSSLGTQRRPGEGRRTAPDFFSSRAWR